MSQSSLTCTTCRRTVPAQICKSNINGNAGRSFVSCENIQPNGSQCKYYRWLSPRSTPMPSPVASPVLLSPSPTLPPAGPSRSSSTVLPVTLTAVSLPSPPSCARPDCTSTRINAHCVNKRCRKHCREIGGCSAKDHHSSGASQAPVASTSSGGPPAPSPSPPPSPSQLGDSTMPASTVLPPPSAPLFTSHAPPSTVDPRPNPCYISQMPPVFTEQYAQEQDLAEKRRKAEAERLSAIAKAKHRVVAYSWIHNSEEPTVFTFQGGFTWPHFVVTLEVLLDLDLVSEEVDDVSRLRILIYDFSLRSWSKFKLPYVVTLKEEQRCIFFKGVKVTECLNFDTHLKNNMTSNKPYNLHRDLPRERTYVRNQWRALKSIMAPVIELTSSDDEDNVSKSRPLAVKPERPLVVKLEPGDDNLKENFNMPLPRAQAILSSESSALPKRKRLPSTSEEDSDSPVSPAGCTASDAICIDDDDDERGEEDGSNDDTGDDYRRKRVWPADFFVVDIVAAFSACDKARRSDSGASVGKTFTSLFGLPFQHTTYYENRKRWDGARQSLREKSLAAGKTPEGLWSVFLKASRVHTHKSTKKHSRR